MPPSTINAAAQKHVQSLCDSLVAEGRERGLQAVAYLNGKLVLDISAGTMHPDAKTPVTPETLFPIYSTGKGITATIIHMLAEKGRLNYDEPIATYWPEFAANGKQNILIRHALNHTSGLANMPLDTSFADFHNWDAMCRRLAAATPETPPGSEILYHAVTYGWILGELAQRIDGRPFAQQVQEQICRPLSLTGMYFGIPDSVENQVATIEEPAPEKKSAPATTPPATTGSIPTCIVPVGLWMNSPVARRACVPGSAGIMNARSLARHYAALLPGGVDGIELLPPSRIQLATQMQFPTRRPEPITRQALGYVLGTTGNIFANCTTGFGHQGYGGSRGFADPKTNLALAFTRNRFHDNDSPNQIINEITSALGIS